MTEIDNWCWCANYLANNNDHLHLSKVNTKWVFKNTKTSVFKDLWFQKKEQQHPIPEQGQLTLLEPSEMFVFCSSFRSVFFCLVPGPPRVAEHLDRPIL